ncbi:hypothetical protein QFZ96_007432 [Paraburkholderia youngii]
MYLAIVGCWIEPFSLPARRGHVGIVEYQTAETVWEALTVRHPANRRLDGVRRPSFRRANVEILSRLGSASVGNNIHPAVPSVGSAFGMLLSQSILTLILYRAATRPSQLPNASSKNGLGATGHGSTASDSVSHDMLEMWQSNELIAATDRKFCRVVQKRRYLARQPPARAQHKLNDLASREIRGLAQRQYTFERRQKTPEAIAFSPRGCAGGQPTRRGRCGLP